MSNRRRKQESKPWYNDQCETKMKAFSSAKKASQQNNCEENIESTKAAIHFLWIVYR